MRLSISLPVAAVVATVALQAQTAREQQQPTFRTGVNLVRVDAYPSRDGRIIEGLTADDFEILEDGVPQKIESFQFIRFEENSPVEEKRDPNSQREGFELAADPSRRVFAIYLDNLHVDFGGSHRMRVPLITFLNRVIGPRDLFGVITAAQRPEDLMLGAQSLMIEEQLTKYWDWGRGGRVLEDDADLMLQACFASDPQNSRLLGEALVRRRVDEVFSDMEGLTHLLAGIREERKNVLLVTNGWPLPRASARFMTEYRPRIPGVGVSGVGKLTTGSRQGEVDPTWCQNELQRLMNIDFQTRFREFVDLARRSNVSFYSIRPSGLAAPATVAGQRFDTAMSDGLRTLAENTDGVAVDNTNDLTAGMRRIAGDLSAMYLLGYYPTNAKPDGRIRRITVRLKGEKGDVRARREYRALTAEEMATMRTAAAARSAPAPVSPADAALAELKRLRPGAIIHTRGAVVGDALVLTTELTAPEVQAGRWKEGADVHVAVSGASGEILTTARGRLEPGTRAAVIRIPLKGAPGPFTSTVRVRSAVEGNVDDSVAAARQATLFGDPLVFRLATPSQPRPAGSVFFRRTERIQVRWPLSAAVTEPQGRVLGRDGVPLGLAVTVSAREDDGTRFLVADLNLAPLTAGEYILEVSAAGAEPAHLAFRVFR